MIAVTIFRFWRTGKQTNKKLWILSFKSANHKLTYFSLYMVFAVLVPTYIWLEAISSLYINFYQIYLFWSLVKDHLNLSSFGVGTYGYPSLGGGWMRNIKAKGFVWGMYINGNKRSLKINFAWYARVCVTRTSNVKAKVESGTLPSVYAR